MIIFQELESVMPNNEVRVERRELYYSQIEDSILQDIYQKYLFCLPKRIKEYAFKKVYSFSQSKYDEIISLGANCATATLLRKLGLRRWSYPFDWVSREDIGNRIDLILNNFENYFNFDDFSFEVKHGKYYAQNHRTGYLMPHDFGRMTQAGPMATYQSANEKYIRRIKRFYDNVRGREVLFVYFEMSKNESKIDIKYLMNLLLLLKQKTKANKVDLLVFRPAIERGEFVEEYILKREKLSIFLSKYPFDLYKSKKWDGLQHYMMQDVKIVCNCVDAL